MDAMAIFFWVWITLAASLFIGEMLTATFFLLPFAIGSVAALIVNMLQLGIIWQWVAFLAVSIIALAICRPLARYLTRGAQVRTGVDRLIGAEALIINQPAPAGLYRAKVDGDHWNVELDPEYPNPYGLQVGERVEVVRIDGTRLVVRRIN